MPETIFVSGAIEDYRAAHDWYLEKGQHVAQSFEAAIEDALERIRSAPERWAKQDARHRRFILRRFPFSIIYRVVQDTVFVIAVAHGRRRPGYWRRRSIAK